MNNIIELKHIEIYEYCTLNKETGEKKFYKDNKKTPGFTGQYYRNDEIFAALYPSEKGPRFYHNGKEYEISPKLNISIQKDGEEREFRIKDYGIVIKYPTSRYIGFDSWSREIDVDLFYKLEQRYKDNKFYDIYTKVEQI